MKEKIITLLTAASLLPCMTALASDIPEKVEISFKIGDSSLMINGNSVEVTAPYVVGDGTTLVPIRVITEAFGAEVTWEDETQTVYLKYPEVDMTVRIGSKSATVNTHNEELAAAPELHNDTTMVPLRFISETFGATVTYDEVQDRVSVVKEAAKETGTTVEGMTDKMYIGDSYHGWTMRNPKTLTMEERSFNGGRTVFNDANSRLVIVVDKEVENTDVDTMFNQAKSAFASTTMSIADKKPAGKDTTLIHIRGKDKETLMDLYSFIKGDSVYSAYAFIDMDEKAEVRDQLLEIANSFSLTAERDYFDLSNVKGDYREFTDEVFVIMLSVPAQWSMQENDGSNSFYFYKDGESANNIHLGIYSKTDTVTAKLLVEKDRESNISVSNPELTTASEIMQGTMADTDTYYYTIERKGNGPNRYKLKDVFFEKGGYVYNLAVATEDDDLTDTIINSFSATEIDAEKMGNIIYDHDDSGNNRFTTSCGTLTAGPAWIQLDQDAFMDRRTTSGLSVTLQSGGASDTPREIVDSFVSYMVSSTGGKVQGNINHETANGKTVYYKTFSVTTDSGNTMYITAYSFKQGGKLYHFVHTRYDLYYGGAVDDEVLEMVSSFEIK